ncbi:MAG: hypothetical protein ACO20G_00065 [Ilumatobacteraceae bacterium]
MVIRRRVFAAGLVLVWCVATGGCDSGDGRDLRDPSANGDAEFIGLIV